MTVTADATDRRALTLAVGGMTCSSCAARIEKRLNRIDGVVATVNFATEQATVEFPDTITPDQLMAAVEETGYTASVPEPDAQAAEESDEAAAWRRRLVVSAALSVPVVLLSMIPALQFPYWQWLALALASPVAIWGAWPFHRAAFANLRHRAATMDTLISVGVGAAYLWSVWALVFTHAGMARHEDGAAPAGQQRWRTPPLSRGRRRRHDLHPRRPLFRGARQAAVRRSASRPARHGRQGRRSAAAWIDRNPHSDKTTRRQRRLRGAARREDRHRRCRGFGHIGGGHVDADRRARAGRRGPRRQRRRCDRQRRWTAGGAGHACRLGHSAGPDGPAGHRSPERQGRGAAAGRPGVGGLRADRHRVVAADAGHLAADRRIGDRRLHRGRRGADHRVPVRAGSGHADRAAGRNRARRPTRNPDQGPADPGVDAAHRHHRAGQDRDSDDRADVASRRCTPPTIRPAPKCSGWQGLSSRHPSIRSDEPWQSGRPRPVRCRR